MRQAVANVLESCTSEGLPFRLFEGYRTPARQEYLFKVRKSTRATAWRSRHQYGVGADFVLWVQKDNGRTGWSWSTRPQYRTMWEKLHEIGKLHDLAHLSFEKPHLQLKGLSTNQLTKGLYPEGGDQTWAENISAARKLYPRGAPPEDPTFSTTNRFTSEYLACWEISDDLDDDRVAFV